jgi:hypothetical protein
MNPFPLNARIIDRDIDFYTGQLGDEQDRARRCPPAEEPYWSERVESCAFVLASLVKYREAIDHPRVPL